MFKNTFIIEIILFLPFESWKILNWSHLVQSSPQLVFNDFLQFVYSLRYNAVIVHQNTEFCENTESRIKYKLEISQFFTIACWLRTCIMVENKSLQCQSYEICSTNKDDCTSFSFRFFTHELIFVHRNVIIKGQIKHVMHHN